jgi:hypothetical protein
MRPLPSVPTPKPIPVSPRIGPEGQPSPVVLSGAPTQEAKGAVSTKVGVAVALLVITVAGAAAWLSHIIAH